MAAIVDPRAGKVPVTVLSGFLGGTSLVASSDSRLRERFSRFPLRRHGRPPTAAGKTSLLSHILNNRAGMKVGMIINDMSEVRARTESGGCSRNSHCTSLDYRAPLLDIATSRR